MSLEFLFLINLLIFFVFGAAIGSFLNVVILRGLEDKTLSGRSECPHCKHKLAIFDLIPIVSFVFLAGKCRYCQKTISFQYPLIEALTGFLFTLALLNFLTKSPLAVEPVFLLDLAFILFLISVCMVVSVIDLKSGLILDKIVLPASLVALIYHAVVIGGQTLTEKGLTLALVSFGSNILTGFGIGSFFLAIIILTSGKGMGGGDAKLGFFIGIALGWPLAIFALFVAFLTGAIGSVMLILLGKKNLKGSVPFGPFLALGTVITVLYGKPLLEAYLKALGV